MANKQLPRSFGVRNMRTKRDAQLRMDPDGYLHIHDPVTGAHLYQIDDETRSALVRVLQNDIKK